MLDVLHPSHFFLGPTLQLETAHVPAAAEPWEIFQGRLLEPRFTRQERTFESWNVFVIDDGVRSGAPLLSLKLDHATGELHVVRGLYCYIWENYTEGGNVLLSRETTRWLRELVGTIDLTRRPDPEELRAELADLVFHAVIGTSRLPLNSVEAPHPLFSLGQLAYVSPLPTSADAGPMRSPRDLIERGLRPGLGWLETTKLLEATLRATPADQLAETADLFAERWRTRPDVERLPALLRSLFNEVALSPWTQFVANTLAVLRHWVERGVLDRRQHIDFLSHLLRQTGRHLTAYDLVTFHHRGANYPDALLLDAVLREYAALVEQFPDEFHGDGPAARVRRRALRQGWLLWRTYEGHPVPDAPTSPGENARVLPPPHVRVPEEQILQVPRRRRRLFVDTPLSLGEHAGRVLRQSVADLAHPEERRELGLAVFIDRPLGVFKAPAEPDLTPLLAYEAFSRSVALRRLRQLAADPASALGPSDAERLQQIITAEECHGLPVRDIPEDPRRVVALADARKVAADFVLLRTLPGGVAAFLHQTGLTASHALEFLTAGQPVLLVRAPPRGGEWETVLAVYDGLYRKRAELEMRRADGYRRRGVVEVPAAGLRVVDIDAPIT
jgi:hypothetical protein